MAKTNLTFVKQVVDYYNTNRSTVRATSDHFGISKTLVHQYLTKIMPNQTSLEILAYNKSVRHIRGGKATKNKYLSKRS